MGDGENSGDIGRQERKVSKREKRAKKRGHENRRRKLVETERGERAKSQ